jgi:hypothetical protein
MKSYCELASMQENNIRGSQLRMQPKARILDKLSDSNSIRSTRSVESVFIRIRGPGPLQRLTRLIRMGKLRMGKLLQGPSIILESIAIDVHVLFIGKSAGSRDIDAIAKSDIS